MHICYTATAGGDGECLRCRSQPDFGGGFERGPGKHIGDSSSAFRRSFFLNVLLYSTQLS